MTKSAITYPPTQYIIQIYYKSSRCTGSLLEIFFDKTTADFANLYRTVIHESTPIVIQRDFQQLATCRTYETENRRILLNDVVVLLRYIAAAVGDEKEWQRKKIAVSLRISANRLWFALSISVLSLSRVNVSRAPKLYSRNNTL